LVGERGMEGKFTIPYNNFTASPKRQKLGKESPAWTYGGSKDNRLGGKRRRKIGREEWLCGLRVLGGCMKRHREKGWILLSAQCLGSQKGGGGGGKERKKVGENFSKRIKGAKWNGHKVKHQLVVHRKINLGKRGTGKGEPKKKKKTWSFKDIFQKEGNQRGRP